MVRRLRRLKNAAGAASTPRELCGVINAPRAGNARLYLTFRPALRAGRKFLCSENHSLGEWFSETRYLRVICPAGGRVWWSGYGVRGSASRRGSVANSVGIRASAASPTTIKTARAKPPQAAAQQPADCIQAPNAVDAPVQAADNQQQQQNFRKRRMKHSRFPFLPLVCAGEGRFMQIQAGRPGRLSGKKRCAGWKESPKGTGTSKRRARTRRASPHPGRRAGQRRGRAAGFRPAAKLSKGSFPCARNCGETARQVRRPPPDAAAGRRTAGCPQPFTNELTMA